MATVNWISVADRLPDDDTLVLIALSDPDVWTGWRDGDIWRYVDAIPLEPGRVTHWAEFPEHPGTDSRASA